MKKAYDWLKLAENSTSRKDCTLLCSNVGYLVYLSKRFQREGSIKVFMQGEGLIKVFLKGKGSNKDIQQGISKRGYRGFKGLTEQRLKYCGRNYIHSMKNIWKHQLCLLHCKDIVFTRINYCMGIIYTIASNIKKIYSRFNSCPCNIICFKSSISYTLFDQCSDTMGHEMPPWVLIYQFFFLTVQGPRREEIVS